MESKKKWYKWTYLQNRSNGYHHQLDRHEFEQAPGKGDGQGSLACCRPWGHKELNVTERLNWTEQNRKTLTDLENDLMVARGHSRGKEEIAREYLKQITKDPRYSTWNSAQGHVSAWLGAGFGGKWIHVSVWLSLSTVHLRLPQHCSQTEPR